MALLNGEEIHERLKEGEIFAPGTWSGTLLRPAGYDLRVSEDVRALNDTLFQEDHRYGEILNLEPGDTAYVLSYERFVMPWDLAANLGLRFRFARLGLSVLTGLLVDPGFGWVAGDGELEPQGAQLHFFLANIGASDIQIRLGAQGDEVLSLQFLETAELQERRVTKAPGDVKAAAALWAYRQMRTLEDGLAGEKAAREEEVVAIQQRIENLTAVVNTTRSATENIVVFGIFLLTVTLIGVSATILLEGLASGNIQDIVNNLNRIHLQGTSATIVTLAGILVIGAVIVALIAAFMAIFTSSFANRDQRGRRLKGPCLDESS